MKSLLLVLSLFAVSTAHADGIEDHIELTTSAAQVFRADRCAHQATERLIEKLMSKMDDPSDLDMLYVASIKRISGIKTRTYSIRAAINSKNEYANYSVRVNCK